MERKEIHNQNQSKGYSLRKGRLISFLKKSNFTLKDIATKIGISERELQERLDDWDYFNAEEMDWWDMMAEKKADVLFVQVLLN